MFYYTGVGSRRAPAEILSLCTRIAEKLAELGWILRSGHAQGCDRAFEIGANGKAEIFLPWRKYGQTPYKDDPGMPLLGQAITDDLREAYDLAASLHPAWEACSEGARRLHARNTQQVLGRDLKSPSKFLICWTPDGAETEDEVSIETGGTGTAIRLADQNNIRVFNLKNEDTLERIKSFLEEK